MDTTPRRASFWNTKFGVELSGVLLLLALIAIVTLFVFDIQLSNGVFIALLLAAGLYIAFDT